MPGFLIAFVRGVEWVNIRVGRAAMWLLFALAGVLLWSVLMKSLFSLLRMLSNTPGWEWLFEIINRSWFQPPLWTQEMAQYTMVGYFVLGGAYSLILGSNVRMDLLYARWSTRKQAAVDSVTVLGLIIFLGVLLWGGIDSTIYALEVGERSRTAWRPYMAPIKIVICIGTFLMLLQSLAFLIRDIATLRGVKI